ncbi:hypothetical protein METESE_28610 [Mesoterricola sediminis]|uniref:Peptidase S53 domain-containing protein n=1 Tax=Mesoterricola sediminis TaxID=2927980 RepID=A0AA48KH02_9BACT|nr:hypothetical protein METESE_28610 [Mesoterricola sediminis]
MRFQTLLLSSCLASCLVAGGDARFTLPDTVHPAVRTLSPLGAADPGQSMGTMILALAIAPEAQARLDRLLADLQDPASPRYHAWLTPEQFAEAFAPPLAQRARVVAWLQAQGFLVEGVSRGGHAIVFSGDVTDVQRAFGAPMQRFSSDGREVLANVLAPSFPPELRDLVRGVVSLNGFGRNAANIGARPVPANTQPGDAHYLAPGDFATIYGLRSPGAAAWDGAGATIGILGRTNPGLKDVNAFRGFYGLPPGGTSLVLNGPDPGSISWGEDLEANLDMQWAGATAPGAAIRFICTASTPSTDGIDLSALRAVDENVSDVISVSFGACEDAMQYSGASFYATLWAQAAAQGITVCVASGDAGVAGCDPASNPSGSRTGVNGLASTAHNVAVGGTQFLDKQGTWWRPTNDPDGTSALGYIPEAAWNESGAAGGAGLWATGGGTSLIWPLPAWQAGLGFPLDSGRAIPDVSFTAALHDGYLVRSGGSLYLVGGTSASTPAFAGILARLVQRSGQRLGNLNRQLYGLALQQAAGNGPAVFHDITVGDNAVPGVAGFAAVPGYDAATGLGSLDAGAFLDAAAGLGVTPQAVDEVIKLGGPCAMAYAVPAGTVPATFRLAGGELPPGLTLAADGTLTGTCAVAGTYTFAVRATDALGRSGTVLSSIQVGPVEITTSAILPGQLTGSTVTYSASVVGALDGRVTWSASGGTVTPVDGNRATFTAAAPGTYQVTAASVADPRQTSSITVNVHGAATVEAGGGSLSGLDVLAMAGRMGTRNAALDLDGDGLVADSDLQELLSLLGW